MEIEQGVCPKSTYPLVTGRNIHEHDVDLAKEYVVHPTHPPVVRIVLPLSISCPDPCSHLAGLQECQVSKLAGPPMRIVIRSHLSFGPHLV